MGADATLRADLDEVVRVAVAPWRAVDVLVNNAGVMPLAFFSDHAAAPAASDRAIDLDLKAVLNGISWGCCPSRCASRPRGGSR